MPQFPIHQSFVIAGVPYIIDRRGYIYAWSTVLPGWQYRGQMVVG